MWKHEVLVEDLHDKAPVVLVLFTSRAWQIGEYLTLIWGAATFPASGFGATPTESLQAALDIIKNARRYRIVQKARKVGESYLRAIRWDEGPLLVHFRAGAPLDDTLMKTLSGVGSDEARKVVAARSGSPLYKTWGTDETLRWERLPADIARIAGTADNDLDLSDDEFWR